MNKLSQAVVASPMEVLMGGAMAIIGIGLATSGQGQVSAAGSILGVLGGILTSWGITKAYVTESATNDIRARLRSLQGRLGTVSGQVGQVARDVLAGGMAAESGCALIIQSTTHLSGLLSDMEEMTGDRLEPETIIATAERVAELSLGLARQAADTPETSNAQSELSSLRSQLKTQIEQARRQDREYREEVVSCPECGESLTWKLGTIAGDSATPHCTACGKRFHAHRRDDSSVFTRKSGPTSIFGAKSFSVKCPNCPTAIPLTVGTDDQDSQIRYCFNCYCKIEIDTTTEAIVGHRMEEPIPGTLVYDEETHRSVLKCSQCDHVISRTHQREHEYLGACTSCERLVISSGRDAAQ